MLKKFYQSFEAKISSLTKSGSCDGASLNDSVLLHVRGIAVLDVRLTSKATNARFTSGKRTMTGDNALLCYLTQCLNTKRYSIDMHFMETRFAQDYTKCHAHSTPALFVSRASNGISCSKSDSILLTEKMRIGTYLHNS